MVPHSLPCALVCPPSDACAGRDFAEHQRADMARTPRERPRSAQAQRYYRYRTYTCGAHCLHADTAAKHAQRFTQWRTRASARPEYHAPPAQPPAATEDAKTRLSRAEAKPSNGYEHSSGHSNGCHCAEAQTTLQLAAVLLQPPSAAKAAKPCGGAPASGCQLQERSQGGFGIKEMLTRGDHKVRDGRRT